MIGTKTIRDMDKNELWDEYRRVYRAVTAMERDLSRLRRHLDTLGAEVDARAGIDSGMYGHGSEAEDS